MRLNHPQNLLSSLMQMQNVQNVQMHHFLNSLPDRGIPRQAHCTLHTCHVDICRFRLRRKRAMFHHVPLPGEGLEGLEGL